jgi:hypothetical protein
MSVLVGTAFDIMVRHMTYRSHVRMFCSKASTRRRVEGSMVLVWLGIWTDETRSPSNSSLQLSGRGVAFEICLIDAQSLPRMRAFVDMMVLEDVVCGGKV